MCTIKKSSENIFRQRLRDFYEDEESRSFDYNLYNYTTKVLLPHKEEIPRLYRYSPADYNNIRSLETKTLYLSEVGGMNDIFEGLSCPINDTVIKNLEDLHDIAYLKSFSEHKNDLLMWSQYGENYSGMCVEYDLRTIDDSLAYHLFPVIYSESRCIKGHPDISYKELSELKYASQHANCPDEVDFLKDVMSLFLYKSQAWEHEAEWRLVVTYLQMHCGHEMIDNGDDYKEHYMINSQQIKFPYASTVYLGPKMKSYIKQHIACICKRLKIKVYETSLSHSSYKLDENEYIADCREENTDEHQ